jgi:hypothetical protein
MPEKDRRTDNWGGYHDYNRDPRQYHFPNSTRDIGWGEYQSQLDRFDNSPRENINWWIVGFFVVLFLLLHNLGVF